MTPQPHSHTRYVAMPLTQGRRSTTSATSFSLQPVYEVQLVGMEKAASFTAQCSAAEMLAYR
jgi:hypothetical protein